MFRIFDCVHQQQQNYRHNYRRYDRLNNRRPTNCALRRLADVRELMRHLPKENRNKAAWRYVAAQLDKATTGTVDTVEVEIALRLVLMLEGVKCRPK